MATTCATRTREFSCRVPNSHIGPASRRPRAVRACRDDGVHDDDIDNIDPDQFKRVAAEVEEEVREEGAQCGAHFSAAGIVAGRSSTRYHCTFDVSCSLPR